MAEPTKTPLDTAASDRADPSPEARPKRPWTPPELIQESLPPPTEGGIVVAHHEATDSGLLS
jgi:hypothetical protein